MTITHDSTTTTVEHHLTLDGYPPIADPATKRLFTPEHARVKVVDSNTVAGVHVFGNSNPMGSMPLPGSRHYWTDADWNDQPAIVADVLRALGLGETAGLK